MKSAKEKTRGAGFIGQWREWIAVPVVLVSYLLFASGRTLDFNRPSWNQYGALAEGFRTGHLFLAEAPDPRLAELSDPYSSEQRGNIPFSWDASYFEGKYYLYFTPLPVLLFYLPFRFLTGDYPTDAMAGCFFFSVAFLLLWAALREALRLLGSSPSLPAAAWTLCLGWGLLLPFTLTRLLSYEIAIGCGLTFSAGWALCLLRYVRLGAGKARFAGLGLFGALAFACRPNLGLLLPACLFLILRREPRSHWKRILGMVVVPYLVLGAILAGYNQARFHSPTEFGSSYQLSFTKQSNDTLQGLFGKGEFVRFETEMMLYLFMPPHFEPTFPYVQMRTAELGAVPKFTGGAEEVGGIFPYMPLLPLGVFCALILFLSTATRRATENLDLVVVLILVAGVLLFFLCTLSLSVSRYQHDFQELLFLGAVLAIEKASEHREALGLSRQVWRGLVMAPLIYSSVLGLLLGFLR